MHANGNNLSDAGSQKLITSRFFPQTAINGFCMSFHYHMYGSNVGQLTVIGMSQDGTQHTVRDKGPEYFQKSNKSSLYSRYYAQVWSE